VNIGLGTAQFGLDYGISNQDGQTSPGEVARILEVARTHAIRVIDTAALYGSSEEVLGRALPTDHDFRVVTKTIRIDAPKITTADAYRLEEAFIASMAKLCCKEIYGLLLHNADDLLAEGGSLLWKRLSMLQKIGRVRKIGVSVYSGEQIEKILDRFTIDLVQLPVNIFDQRLIAGGQLAELKSRGVEIHARSPFLQGLLLMPPEAVPSYFAPIREHLEHYHMFLRMRGITPVQAALGFLSACDAIDTVICGVNNHIQLTELCRSATPLPNIDFSAFALNDVKILNPSRWESA
jgi:aryl-alcohol dehydrogenase-like predicted oxidoreductase